MFYKKELVDEEFKSKDSMTVEKNGDGTLRSNKKYTVPPFEEKYQFNEDSISNIFLLADIADNYCITIDTTVDHAFYIHFLDKVLKFRQFANCLHSLDPSYKTNILSFKEYNKLFSTEKKTQLTNIVENNLCYLSSY